MISQIVSQYSFSVHNQDTSRVISLIEHKIHIGWENYDCEVVEGYGEPEGHLGLPDLVSVGQDDAQLDVVVEKDQQDYGIPDRKPARRRIEGLVFGQHVGPELATLGLQGHVRYVIDDSDIFGLLSFWKEWQVLAKVAIVQEQSLYFLKNC